MKLRFPGSRNYWEKRYLKGGNSGHGSYNILARYKAGTINPFVKQKKIKSVIEFGCGDGNQLGLAKYPKYIGLDVSSIAIKWCIDKFKNDKTKSFFLYDSEAFADNARVLKCDLALSLDVIFHLIEANAFESHLRHLFSSSEKYVIIYSSNKSINKIGQGVHVKHRFFTKWISKNIKGWKLDKKIKNKYPLFNDDRKGSFSDFYIYKRTKK